MGVRELNLDFSQGVSSPVAHFVLPQAFRQHLGNQFLRVSSPYEDFTKFFGEMASLRIQLPTGLLSILGEFRSQANFTGILLLRNMPIDSVLPESPVDGKHSPLKTTFVSESSLGVTASCLGSIFGYRFEKEGALIHNISPVKAKQKSLSNEGSEADFLFHTEVAFSKDRPDYLMLLGLRQGPYPLVPTRVARAVDALDLLSKSDIKALSESRFQLFAPESFAKSETTGPVAVLGGDVDSPRLRLNLNHMLATDSRAEVALSHLAEALEQTEYQISLEPGDLLILDNHKVVHGRLPFHAAFNGQDRWLQRAYLRETSHAYDQF